MGPAEAALEALLRTEAPALLGIQDALPDQAEVVRLALGTAYRMVGRGRSADGTGERCPIVYDSERLELTAWDQYALSDQPMVAGSMSWGNLIPRIMVCATFRDRTTAVRFLAINTLWDHISRRSRIQSARAIRARVALQPLPVVMTGDLNAAGDTACLRELFSGGSLIDAWLAAKQQVTPEWGTFPNYHEPQWGDPRLDRIVVTADIAVATAAINPGRYDGAWVSDHLPIQAVMRIPLARDGA